MLSSIQVKNSIKDGVQLRRSSITLSEKLYQLSK